MSVLVWVHGGKSLDDLPDETRLGVERATIQGDPVEILRQDKYIDDRAAQIAAKAKAAIQDAHATLLPRLHAELEKVITIFTPVYAAHQCQCEIEDSGPVRRIQRSIADSERCVRGEFGFDFGHIAGELPTWL